MAKIRVRDSFRADVRAQIAWIRRIRAGLREARQLHARFPGAGVGVEDRAAGELRKLVLRQLPFNVLYIRAKNTVWLVRLFHHRQDE
jgi:plasmid stabilization system protein ParE